MNDLGSTLLVISFGYPHVLKSRKRGEDHTSNNCREISFRRNKNLYPCGIGSFVGNLSGKPFSETSEHRRTAALHNILKKLFPSFNIAYHYRCVSDLVNSRMLFPCQYGIK
jgi:hypothetical protein